MKLWQFTLRGLFFATTVISAGIGGFIWTSQIRFDPEDTQSVVIISLTGISLATVILIGGISAFPYGRLLRASVIFITVFMIASLAGLLVPISRGYPTPW